MSFLFIVNDNLLSCVYESPIISRKQLYQGGKLSYGAKHILQWMVDQIGPKKIVLLIFFINPFTIPIYEYINRFLCIYRSTYCFIFFRENLLDSNESSCIVKPLQRQEERLEAANGYTRLVAAVKSLG